jgi:NitT/TauT family transport system permease protein
MTAVEVAGSTTTRRRLRPVATAAPAPTRRLPWRILTDALPPLAVAGVVIGGWYAATYLLLTPRRRFLLPAPHDVLQKGLLDGTARGEIFQALVDTARVAGVGLLLASLLGVALAIAMSQARWVERSLYPWAILLQTIPILAIVPLIGFWWGFDFRSRVAVCVLISLFPMITNTLFGLQSTASGLHDVFSIRKVSRLSRLWHLQLPAAMPSIFTGLRISAGLSVIGSIVGDFFFRQGEPGIGRLIDNYRAQLASEQLFAAILASSALGLLVFVVVGAVGERVVGRWHDSGKRR